MHVGVGDDLSDKNAVETFVGDIVCLCPLPLGQFAGVHSVQDTVADVDDLDRTCRTHAITGQAVEADVGDSLAKDEHAVA